MKEETRIFYKVETHGGFAGKPLEVYIHKQFFKRVSPKMFYGQSGRVNEMMVPENNTLDEAYSVFVAQKEREIAKAKARVAEYERILEDGRRAWRGEYSPKVIESGPGAKTVVEDTQ